MVPRRGPLNFRQYLPRKANKDGIKCYKLCSLDSFTHNLQVHSGKSEVPNKRENVGHGHKVVLQMMEGLFDAGRTLYIDNFYRSVGLAEDLLGRETYVCGTLRANRKGKPEVRQKKLKRGEIIARQNGKGVRVMKWQDKRPVKMISSNPDLGEILLPTTSKSKRGEII